jgi:acetyl esterase/lipase
VPLLLFVYGGGWDSGDRTEYSFAGRALAGLGFLVAVADYRVFPEVTFPAFVDDLGLAANWLLAHAAQHGGEPDRFFLAGHSAGAYNAVMLALQPARFGAPGLAGKIEAVVGLSGPYDFYPYDVKQSIDAFGPYDDPLSTQPVNLVTSAAPPMLLAHGAQHGGDPGRVVLAGHSAGAYNAVMLALQPDRFGAPDLAGKIEAVVGLSGPYDFYPYDVKQSIDAFGPYDDPLSTQPVNLVTSAAPPMLLAQGERDTTVGDYHTVRLAAILRGAGVPVVERHYPALGHPQTVLGLMRPFRRLWPVWGDVRAFLAARR